MHGLPEQVLSSLRSKIVDIWSKNSDSNSARYLYDMMILGDDCDGAQPPDELVVESELDRLLAFGVFVACLVKSRKVFTSDGNRD